MKSLKTKETPAPAAQKATTKAAGRTSKSAKAETQAAVKSSSAKKAATKPAAASAPATKAPKKKAAVKTATGAKKAIKNAIKFDKKITDKLKKIVANYTEYPELLDNIERDTTKSFIDELNIDSVDFVEIIVDVEQEFDITIEDDEIYDLKSFEDLYSAIDAKIKQAKK